MAPCYEVLKDIIYINNSELCELTDGYPPQESECPQYPKAIDWYIYTYGHNELNFIQDT